MFNLSSNELLGVAGVFSLLTYLLFFILLLSANIALWKYILSDRRRRDRENRR